jgi:glyoxylase-like metal-dependent hydrolase (beta-lactamase superfamily II)
MTREHPNRGASEAPRRYSSAALGVMTLVTLVSSGCSTPVAAGLGAVGLATTGPTRSMVAAYDTGAGVLLVDLGWWRAESSLHETLGQAGHDVGDVTAVFVTHAHRDHIAGWPAVEHATFYLSEAEAPYFFGEAEYQGFVPRLADRIVSTTTPARSEVRVVTFAADTAFVFGADTLRAFLVPGHTPGSSAYLLRGTLFAGDALTRTMWSGFRHSRPIYADDPDRTRESLSDLFRRLEGLRVDYVCDAHAHCARYDEAFRRDVEG